MLSAKSLSPIKDGHGSSLVADTTFDQVPRLDVPGAPGQQALMEDEETLASIGHHAAHATYVFSVNTGTLLREAACSRETRQIHTRYQPEPPFDSGTPVWTAREAVEAARLHDRDHDRSAGDGEEAAWRLGVGVPA